MSSSLCVLDNTIEAGADIGGLAAALHLVLSVAQGFLVALAAVMALAPQIAGIVQGFPTPPLMLLMMSMNRRRVMGSKTNSLLLEIVGWTVEPQRLRSLEKAPGAYRRH